MLVAPPSAWCIIFTILVASALELSVVLWERRYAGWEPPEVAALSAQVRQLRARMRELSPVGDFVEYSFAQRKVNKVTKERDALKERTASNTTWPSVASRFVRPLCMLVGVGIWWDTAVVCVPAWWLWPLTWLLGFPGHESGCIGVVAWTLVCFRVCGVALAPLRPPPVAKPGILARLTGGLL